MSLREKFRERDEQVVEQERVSHLCAAHGCPLPGTWSDHTRGGGPWMCRWHASAQPETWPMVTQHIASGEMGRQSTQPVRIAGFSERDAERLRDEARRRKQGRLEWAARVFERYIAGDPKLAPIAVDFAREAVTGSVQGQARTVGEDDA